MCCKYTKFQRNVINYFVFFGKGEKKMRMFRDPVQRRENKRNQKNILY